jgi:hypothetical protein
MSSPSAGTLRSVRLPAGQVDGLGTLVVDRGIAVPLALGRVGVTFADILNSAIVCEIER